jgi:polyribonucleotide nucleotidyltransferase
VIIGCVIGNGGQIIRSLQKDFSVNMRIDRGEDGKQDSVIIKGATSKAIPAKAKVSLYIYIYVFIFI